MELAALSWAIRIQELEELLKLRRQELESQLQISKEEQEKLAEQQRRRDKLHRQLSNLLAEEAQLTAKIANLQHEAEELAAAPSFSTARRPLIEAAKRSELLCKIMKSDTEQTRQFQTLINAKVQKQKAGLEALKAQESEVREMLARCAATPVGRLEDSLSCANAEIEHLQAKQAMAQTKLKSLQTQNASQAAIVTDRARLAQQVMLVKKTVEGKKASLINQRRQQMLLEERLQQVQKAKQQALAKQEELQQSIRSNAELINSLYC